MFRPIPGDATPGRRARGSDDAEVAALREEVERLLLITEALWRIAREKLSLDDNELIRQITLLDLEDGKLDARKPITPPRPCPKCNRVLTKHRPRCLFCGEPIVNDPFAR